MRMVEPMDMKNLWGAQSVSRRSVAKNLISGGTQKSPRGDA